MNNDNSDFVQNRFTKYLMTAVERNRARYLTKQQRIQDKELYIPELLEQSNLEFAEIHSLFITERTESAARDWEKMQELLLLIEDEKIVDAVGKLKEKERSIVFGRIFGELTFDELAKKTNMTMDQARQAYFYALRKLRKELKK